HPGKRRIYLDLPQETGGELRLSAKRHRRTVCAEATALLEGALRPDLAEGETADSPPGSGSYRDNSLYLELSAGLLARLGTLAEGDCRSVAGEAAQILQAILRQSRPNRNANPARRRRV